MPIQKCDMQGLARKIRAVRKLRPQVAANLRPLFNHTITLAISSAKHGYCQRAGREIYYARQLAEREEREQVGDLMGARRKRRKKKVRSTR